MLSILLSALLSLAPINQKVASDISYTTSKDSYKQERCKLDVYVPEGLDGKTCPVVVWFHGGGLTGGNKHFPEGMKGQKVIVISANYRLMPKVTIDACIDDAAEAVAWAFKHAAEYGGDTNHLFVSGHSAGGYLTAMIGLEKKWLAKYGVDPDRIAALVPFSGQMITHFAHRDMNGIPNLQPTIDEFAPLYHVRANCPPVYLITGGRDVELFGRYEENAYMARMLKLTGHKKVFLYELDGFDHGAMAGPACHILIQAIREN